MQGLEGCGCRGAAQSVEPWHWATERVVAPTLETPMGERPKWQKSSPGRDEAGGASRWWLSSGSQSAVSHVMQDANTQAGTTTLGRVPVVDVQPYSPCSLTFEAQNSVAVAETAVIDHGSHNIDIPVKRHFQEACQPRGSRTQNEESRDRAENQGAKWYQVEHGAEQKVQGGTSQELPEAEQREAAERRKETEAADWEKEQQ